MMRKYLTLTLGVIALTGLGISAQERDPVSVSISMPDSAIHAGAAARLDVLVRNISDRDVIVYQAPGTGGHAEAGSQIEVRDFKGRAQERLDRTHVSLGGVDHALPKARISRRGVTLKPGEQMKDFAVLSKLFDLSNPGNYKVMARTDVLVLASESGPKLVQVLSNTVTLSVGARDANP